MTLKHCRSVTRRGRRAHVLGLMSILFREVQRARSVHEPPRQNPCFILIRDTNYLPQPSSESPAALPLLGG